MKSSKSFIMIFVILVIAGTGLTIFALIRDMLPDRVKASDGDPFSEASTFVSTDRMMDFIEKISEINKNSGWRGSTTTGEAIAFEIVAQELDQLDWLSENGMTVERESFNVFAGTQDHLSKVSLSSSSATIDIDADSARGHRDNLDASVRMDSDGELTDNELNPVTVRKEIVTIPDADTLNSLQKDTCQGKIFLVNYEIVDTGLQTNDVAIPKAEKILQLEPSGIILITQASNTVGESHGTFIGDGGGGFQRITDSVRVPMVFIKFEELSPLGVKSWNEMKKITEAGIIWDVDVTNPADSENLIVHIPGVAGAKPMLISAHLDSAHSGGALDDGTGSAILMEIAKVLNETKITPTVDLYLAWYGSEEIGLYGSTYFTTTHSDLLHDLQGNIQIDSLTRPLDGLPANITLSFSHFTSSSIETDPLAVYLDQRAENLGQEMELSFWPFSSDNGSLTAFDISNTNMIYESESMNNTYAGVWYAGHMHDPYDNLQLVEDMQAQLMGMAKLALSGAFIPMDQQEFSQRNLDKKVLFIASHTESPHMTPTGFPEFSLALIKAGYEISVLPYGKDLSEFDLSKFDLVIVLPVYDYPVQGNTAYDTNWSEEEATKLNAYAQEGGTVIVINSAYRLKLYNQRFDLNEDWSDLNVLTDQWGVHFSTVGTKTQESAAVLNGQNFRLFLTPENTVSFTAPEKSIAAGTSTEAYLAELQIGTGKVIVLSDMTALGENDFGLTNDDLVRVIAGIK